MQVVDDDSELRDLAPWKAHKLIGDRKGVWSLSVTGNYRMSFCVDADEREIYDGNLEDYH